MATITFGPPNRQWTYSPLTKTYDLSPSTSPTSKLTISTTAGAPETSFTVDSRRTALVIVDMQNFFLDPQCMNHPAGLAAVGPTIKLIAKCRSLGIQVIWLNWGLTDKDMETMPAGVNHGFLKSVIISPPSTRPSSKPYPYLGLGADLGAGKGRLLFSGSWNADIYPALKEHAVPEEDKFCSKDRMSGLWTIKTQLYKCLKEGGWETLLFCGVNTDQCVLGTLVDAYNKGWNCVAVEDCCGTTTEGGREVSLRNVAGCYGFVTDAAAILAAK